MRRANFAARDGGGIGDMNWGQFVIQWLHVGLGVLWFGTVLYNATILIPAISRLSLPKQREIGRAIGEQGFKVIRPVAGAVILLGIIRGTFFGPIKGFEDLTTAYGITWLVGLAFARRHPRSRPPSPSSSATPSWSLASSW
jgi:hypothetical protein